MKLYRILYGALGLILLAGTILTGSYGLSAENKSIYEEAVDLQDQVDAIGFEGFRLADYKVRFFDGDVDYVISGNAIKKEDAALTTFVGTAYEVDGEYQVILPTIERFSDMFKLLGSAESLAEGNVNFDESEYGSKEHIATLWHEATHAYQLTKYEDEITGVLKDNSGDIQDIIVSSVDGNQNVVELYKKQMELLNKAYDAENLTEKQAYIADYLDLEHERRTLLSEEACAAEDYYEVAEGTARYIESQVYCFLEGNDAFEEAYTGQTEYENGSGKYYTSGMMKCYLLDELDPDWKTSYDFSVNLTELLEAL
ncbi:MAG: hypothetical protein ACRC3H_15550 [Lachnospiraceae bacterium]